MNGMVKFEISRSDVVPEEGRVAWLEKHGTVSKKFKVQVSAPLEVWARVAKIGDDGEIKWDQATNRFESPARKAERRIETTLAARLREDPKDLSDFDAAEILKDEATKAEEAERAAEEQEAAKARKIAELAKWVTSNPAPFEANVVRAASEGRDVRGAVRRAIVARTEEVIDSLDNFGRPAVAYDFELDKRTPTQAAYAIRDAIVGVTGELLEAVALPGAALTVSDFGRINVSKEDKKVWRSAIRIEIEHPWASPIEMSVLTEPLNYEEAEEEDD